MEKIGNKLFAGLTDFEFAELLRVGHAREVEYDKDDLILLSGDVTPEFGVVLQGSVNIENVDVWGNVGILDNVSQGGLCRNIRIFENTADGRRRCRRKMSGHVFAYCSAP